MEMKEIITIIGNQIEISAPDNGEVMKGIKRIRLVKGTKGNAKGKWGTQVDENEIKEIVRK